MYSLFGIKFSFVEVALFPVPPVQSKTSFFYLLDEVSFFHHYHGVARKFPPLTCLFFPMAFAYSTFLSKFLLAIPFFVSPFFREVFFTTRFSPLNALFSPHPTKSFLFAYSVQIGIPHFIAQFFFASLLDHSSCLDRPKVYVVFVSIGCPFFHTKVPCLSDISCSHPQREPYFRRISSILFCPPLRTASWFFFFLPPFLPKSRKHAPLYFSLHF